MPSFFAFKGDYKYLKKWGASIPSSSKVFFLSCNPENSEIRSLALKFGWKAVDYSNAQRWSQERMVKEYLDLIGSVNQWNATTLHWWATHFSSKNRLHSPVLPYLQELHQSLSAIETLQPEDSLVLINISWPVIDTLQSLSSESGYSFQLFSTPFLKSKDFVKAKIIFLKNLLAEIIFSLLSIWKAKKAFGEPNKIDPKCPVYLIKSFTYLRNFSNDKYQDPFFGKLPDYLSEQLSTENVLTVALGFQDREDCYRGMKALESGLVHPMEIYLTYWDVIKRTFEWLWVLSFQSVRIKGQLSWLGYDVTIFFRELIHHGGLGISFFQAIHFDAACRLGKMYNIRTCLMTYEGRPWERFFIAGLRTSSPKVHIIGCQHTVIPLSAVDMFLHPKEERKIPLPDKIVTTGSITKNILDKYSTYPKDQVYAGCALRYETLQELSLLSRKISHDKAPGKFIILVAFGGSDEEVPLLNYALEQAEEMPDVFFLMRTHPAFPFDKLLRLSRWKNKNLPKNVEESLNSNVIEDIKACNAVLYWGTTVSLEALMLGKPIIQFDRGDFLNYDPLFDFIEFKWQVSKESPLNNALNEIQNLPDTRYVELQKRGRKYVEDYFYPVTKDRLSLFLPNADC